jgi:peptide/nickel transport system substrate-binding protein
MGNDHPIGPSQPFFNTELEQKEYDPDRARFHLSEAGLDSLDVDINLADAAFAGAMDAGVLFSESAAAAGINLNVVREPNDGYWSNVWMQKPFAGTYWGGRPTPDWMFATAYAEGVPWNETYWSNERFNELLLQARSELDQDLRSRDVLRDAADRLGRRRHHHPDVRPVCRRLFRRAGPSRPGRGQLAQRRPPDRRALVVHRLT